MEGSLERIREALKHDDDAELNSALEELRGRWSEAAAKASQAAEAPAGAPEGAGPETSAGAAPEEDVIEADYEVVDEEK